MARDDAAPASGDARLACVDFDLTVLARHSFAERVTVERVEALEAAALTKRIVAIAMETRAIVNRVRQKLIEAGFVDVEALTPYDPEA